VDEKKHNLVDDLKAAQLVRESEAQENKRAKQRHRAFQMFQPERGIQNPIEAKKRGRDGYRWGKHLVPQQCAYILWAISCADAHSVSAITEKVNRADRELKISEAMVRERLKSMALTGFVVPYIQPLPRNRHRFMFFALGQEPTPEHDVMNLEEMWDRVDGDTEMNMVEWIPKARRIR